MNAFITFGNLFQVKKLLEGRKNHQKIECVYLGFKLTVFDFFPTMNLTIIRFRQQV